MKASFRERMLAALLFYATPLIFLAVFIVFGSQAPSFFALESIGQRMIRVEETA